jgi:hypothetical protein
MDYNSEIHKYYLSRCNEITASMRGAVVLKTDLWNEVRLDVPGSGAIIGSVKNVKKWVSVEVAEQRIDLAREFGVDAEIIQGRIQDVEFGLESFDAIFCFGTTNYMGFPSARKTIGKFSEWLKGDGKLYVSAWVWGSKNTMKDSDKPGERFYHNIDEWEKMLSGYFPNCERELIDSQIVNYEKGNLIGYKCEL